MPLLVLKLTPYSDQVPIQIGTTITDKVLQKITSEELNKADFTWQHTHMSMVVTAKGAQPAVDFDLTKIDSDLMMTMSITIPLFGCRGVKGITAITCHSQ